MSSMNIREMLRLLKNKDDIMNSEFCTFNTKYKTTTNEYALQIKRTSNIKCYCDNQKDPTNNNLKYKRPMIPAPATDLISRY